MRDGEGEECACSPIKVEYLDHHNVQMITWMKICTEVGCLAIVFIVNPSSHWPTATDSRLV